MKNSLIKPPIRAFGGKSNMLKTLMSHFPEQSDYNIFIDAFGFSGAVLLAEERPGKIEIYNDIYENVYALYKCLQDKNMFQELKEKCDLAIYSSQFRKEYKEKLKEKDMPIVDRAFMYWYVNRSSHGGMGGLSVNCVIRRKMAKSTSDFLSCIDRLPQIHSRLSTVIIENRDALELINKYNTPNTFIYLDPPYAWETRTSVRYVHDFTPEQQKKLIDILLTAKFKFLLSGYANQEYKRLEDNGIKRIDFQVNTVSGNGLPKVKTESLYKNY
jgi:DNA adenine methylase